jgi:hypothetical protein
LQGTRIVGAVDTNTLSCERRLGTAWQAGDLDRRSDFGHDVVSVLKRSLDGPKPEQIEAS